MLLLVGIVVAVTLLVVFFDLTARRRRQRVFGSTAKQYELIVCDGRDGAPGPGDVGSIVSGDGGGFGADF